MEENRLSRSQKTLLPLSDADLEIAEQNLAMCLEAYDQRGEAGLQEALDQIYPPELEEDDQRSLITHHSESEQPNVPVIPAAASFRRERFMNDSFALKATKSLP